MDIDISVNKRQISPYKVAVKQFESETTTLVFTLDNYKYDQVDLRNYKAYVVTSINGFVDLTELAMSVSGTQITLTWVVQERTLRYAGAITYQIVFKENTDDGDNTAVFNTYEAILQCSESIDAERPIQGDYPTIFKQWLDLINSLAGTYDAEVVYMPVGEPIPYEARLAGRLYYQVENATTYEGRFEDHNGKRLGEFNAKHVADPDFNTMLEHGEYFCVGGLNSGLNSPMNCQVAFLNVTDSGSANQQLQTFYGVENNQIRTFVRSVKGTDFGAWQELATTTYVDTAVSPKQNKNVGTANMVLVTDANGNIAASSIITTTELNALNGYVSGAGTIENRLSKIEGGSTNGLIGEIKWYAGSSVPTGYLKCDGSAKSRTTYSKLFAAIGTTWGVGDGSSTFNLPNLIGRVAWGAHAAGGYKEAGLPNITGTFYSGGTVSSQVSGAITKMENMMTFGNGGGYSEQDMEVKLDASTSSPIYGNSNTVQPPAANLIPIIKY